MPSPGPPATAGFFVSIRRSIVTGCRRVTPTMSRYRNFHQKAAMCGAIFPSSFADAKLRVPFSSNSHANSLPSLTSFPLGNSVCILFKAIRVFSDVISLQSASRGGESNPIMEIGGGFERVFPNAPPPFVFFAFFLTHLIGSPVISWIGDLTVGLAEFRQGGERGTEC